MYLSNLPNQNSKHCRDYAVKEEQEAIGSVNDSETNHKLSFLKIWLRELAKKIKLFCLFTILFCSSFLFAQKNVPFSYTGGVQTYTVPCGAFTPYGDGINDFFFGEGIGIKQYAMSIYDRWENQIFSCSEYKLSQSSPCKWDGGVEQRSSSGYDVQQDVYVWKVNYTCVFGGEYSLVGNVTVNK